MLQDRMKLEQLAEEARHNKASEAIEAEKAAAQRSGVRQKYLDTAVKAAGGLAKLVGGNDLGWYNSGIDHMGEAGNLSFVTYDAGQKSFVDGQQRLLKRARASLMTLSFDITLGGSKMSTIPPYYMAVYDIYNTIRSRNRGATNYSVNDLLTYLFVPSSWAVMFAQIERLFKIYNNPDMYAPITVTQIFSALGINYSSFQNDYNNILSALEHAKAVCSQIAMPITFNAVKRWIWLSTSCFIDSYNRTLRQIIVPHCYKYHSVNTSDPHYATSVITDNVFNPAVTSFSADILGLLRSIENEALAIISNAGFKAIAGDIINAYGSAVNGIVDWRATFNPEADPFVYDEEFLVQYGNLHLTVLPTTVFNQLALMYGADGKLGQGYLLSNGNMSGFICGLCQTAYTSPSDSGGSMLRPVLKPRLSNEEVFMATRMMFRYTSSSAALALYYYDPTTDAYVADNLTAPSGYNLVVLDEWGTEIYHNLVGLTFDPTSGAPTTMFTLSGDMGMGQVLNMAAINSFEVVPPIFVTATYDQANNAQVLFAPVDEYAVISVRGFSNINTSALLGLWSAKAASARPDERVSRPRFNPKGSRKQGKPADDVKK